jgi:hypothetical protein
MFIGYVKPTNLLSTENAKTVKGEKVGYTTYIMYLAPHTQNSKGINLCPHASEGCAKACLFGSGSARFEKTQQGKQNKTEYFLADRKAFLEQLVNEIAKIEKRHAKSKKKFAVRLNGTSDIRFEKLKINGKNIFDTFPNVQFYDYTKNPIRMFMDMPKNYHLTFSMSEDNKDICLDMLKAGKNVAMVFGIKKSKPLPNEYMGFKVINGDETDLRFLDDDNVIVGLKYKMIMTQGQGFNKEQIETNDFIITDF